MPMRRMVKTTVTKGSNGQYKVTIPKGIADAMELDCQKIKWKVKSGNTLEVTIVDE